MIEFLVESGLGLRSMISNANSLVPNLVVALAFVGCSSRSSEPIAESRSLPIVRGSELRDYVAASELPVLVEFGVDYQCERCRQMKQSIVELGDKFEGRASIVRVDFNQNAGLVSQFGGTVCPTYVFFQGGKVVKTESFPVSTDILESQLEMLSDLTRE